MHYFVEIKEPSGRCKIWAGTPSGGVFSFYPEDHFKLIDAFSETTLPALPSNGVRDMLADKDGYIYVMTSIGMVLLSPRSEGGCKLQPTDGFADQQNPQGRKYGSKRLKRLLESYAHLPMRQQQLLLTTELDSHREHEPQRDDITILGVKIHPEAS